MGRNGIDKQWGRPTLRRGDRQGESDRHRVRVPPWARPNGHKYERVPLLVAGFEFRSGRISFSRTVALPPSEQFYTDRWRQWAQTPQLRATRSREGSMSKADQFREHPEKAMRRARRPKTEKQNKALLDLP